MARHLWNKGESGNPKGRPKGSGYVERCKEWADKHGWDILEKLAKSDDPKIVLEATKLLMAYGIGKPREHHTIDGSIRLESVITGDATPA